MELKYKLDCDKMTERKAAHRYIKEILNFPEYYGNNLDALYDCLSEMPSCRIALTHAEAVAAMGGYGEALLKVFEEAAEENSRLKVEFFYESEETEEDSL